MTLGVVVIIDGRVDFNIGHGVTSGIEGLFRGMQNIELGNILKGIGGVK